MSAPSTDKSRPLALIKSGGIEIAAFYGAFLLIAAVVFGAVSVHPF